MKQDMNKNLYDKMYRCSYARLPEYVCGNELNLHLMLAIKELHQQLVQQTKFTALFHNLLNRRIKPYLETNKENGFSFTELLNLCSITKRQ